MIQHETPGLAWHDIHDIMMFPNLISWFMKSLYRNREISSCSRWPVFYENGPWQALRLGLHFGVAEYHHFLSAYSFSGNKQKITRNVN